MNVSFTEQFNTLIAYNRNHEERESSRAKIESKGIYATLKRRVTAEIGFCLNALVGVIEITAYFFLSLLALLAIPRKSAPYYCLTCRLSSSTMATLSSILNLYRNLFYPNLFTDPRFTPKDTLIHNEYSNEPADTQPEKSPVLPSPFEPLNDSFSIELDQIAGTSSAGKNHIYKETSEEASIAKKQLEDDSQINQTKSILEPALIPQTTADSEERYELPSSIDTNENDPMIESNPSQPMIFFSSPAIQFLEVLISNELINLKMLWESLLLNVPQKLIKSFETISDNQFLLTFSRRTTLWIDSKDSEGASYPKGGTIIHLGDEKHPSIKFEIDRQTSKIKFLSGLQFYCNTHSPLGIKDVIVVYMRCNEEEIIINAGIKVFLVGLQTDSRTYQKDAIIEMWREATLLEKGEDRKSYLKNKISEQS